MTRSILTTLALLLCAVEARAADEYVTLNGKLMCKTQQSLREALRAIDTKDRALLRTVQGCHQSIEGVRAEVLQDNVSMLKVKVGEAGEEFWILPDTIKPVRR
jgi:hypothetical protein